MGAIVPNQKLYWLFIYIFILGCSSSLFAQRVDSLLFFDCNDNALFVMTYAYQGDRVIQRNLYDADGAFLRSTVIQYNGAGKRIRETYLDYKGDTCSSSIYSYSSDVAAGFDYNDYYNYQPKVYSGNYARSSEGHYDFTRASGTASHSMDYEYDDQGHVTRVNVFDSAGVLTHYVKVVSPDIIRVEEGVNHANPQHLIESIGPEGFNLRLSIGHPTRVGAVLYDIRGRVVAVPMHRVVAEGNYKMRIQFKDTFRLRNSGVYLLKVSTGSNQEIRKLVVVR